MNGALYDAAGAGIERRVFVPLRRRVLAQLRGAIADVGAGTGANFPFYPASARVLALEPDPSMAKRARSRIAASRAQVELRDDDDGYLDRLPPGSLDAVVFTLVLCSIDDPGASVRRAKRALKAQGRLVLLEHVRSDGALGHFQDFVAPLWRHVLGGCRPNRDTLAVAAEAGFDTSAIETVTLSRISPIRKLICGVAALERTSFG